MGRALRRDAGLTDPSSGLGVGHARRLPGDHPPRLAGARVAILFAFHALVFAACYAFAYLLRFEFAIPAEFNDTFKWSLPVVLGVQLLMTESREFGRHQGLNLISGEVIPLNNPHEGGRRLKVPQVGWNRIHACRGATADWSGTPLEGLHDGEFMYFVHSFVVVPEERSVVLSTSMYGDVEFCSSVTAGPIFACQFHPERSGRRGLLVYDNLRAMIDAGAAERRTSA